MNNVALICDDKYALPTMVCIQSIIMNTNADTTIHVCTFGLSDENMTSFNRLSTDKVKVIVDVFASDMYSDLLNRINQKSHVTPTALIKFELSSYFKELDRLLYIDSDIIVRKDLSTLFTSDLSGLYLAASYEFYKYLENKRYRFRKHWDESFFFNSGVMLLNLKKMREDNISEKLWDYKLNRAKTTLMDQESLIAICSEKALHLPIRWNFNPVFYNQEYLEDINKVYNASYSSIGALLDDVAVIHYVGKKDKPWIYSTARMRDYWTIVYDAIDNIPEIQPITDSEKIERSNAIKKIVDQYGIEGLVCYYRYRLNQKFLKR